MLYILSKHCFFHVAFFCQRDFFASEMDTIFFSLWGNQTFFIPAESKSWEPVCVGFPLTRTFAKVNTERFPW